MAATSIATELVGGVDISHHWSNFDIMEISTGKSHDIQFSWGPYYAKYFFQKEFYNFRHLVFIGYPYDNLFVNCKEKSKPYRQKILSKGAKFIVCFFDQAYSNTWPKVNEDIAELYRSLLQKVLKDTEFGLIVKPKKVKNFWERPALCSIYKLAKEAEGTGRCLFLDGNIAANEAAQAADLVVGFAVYSTPSLEAALAGLPAITCDVQYFSNHPFYLEGGFNSIIFRSIENMMQAVEQFYHHGKRLSVCGDYGFILKDIDPFGDGKAYKRAGSLIRNLLNEFDRGGSRQEAIDKVISQYRHEWGSDKVVDFQLAEKS